MAKKTTSTKASKQNKKKPATTKSSGSARSGRTSGTKSAKPGTPVAKKSGGGPAAKATSSSRAAKPAVAAKDRAKPSKPAPGPIAPKGKDRVVGTVKDKAAASPPAPEQVTGKKKSLSRGGKRGRSVAEAASDVRADSKGYVFINGRRVRMISTKGAIPAKKHRQTEAAPAPVAAPKPPIQSIKTSLSRKELSHYRELLLQKRRELAGDLHAMETQALRSGGGNLSHMPIHMADIGTDTYDQDFMLGLAETERQQLREIDQALQRVEDRTYGVCQVTGEMIPTSRLDAKPWAKYTIEAARRLEGQWGT